MASQSAEMELTEDMRCASMALAVSLDSSADHRLVHRMRSLGTQCSYTLRAAGEGSNGAPTSMRRAGLSSRSVAQPALG